MRDITPQKVSLMRLPALLIGGITKSHRNATNLVGCKDMYVCVWKPGYNNINYYGNKMVVN